MKPAARSDARELALLAALLVFVAGLCLRPMDESDLFFRLRVGQEILAHHALPGRNLFSFTAPDHPDLDLAWGFEVAAALLYRWGGFPAVVVGKTVVLLVVFAGAFAVCRRRGAGPLVTTVVLAGAALVMRDRLVERPHVVSFLGEVLVLAALARVDRAWTWRSSSRSWLAFAAVLVVWANAHAGLFVAALMFGLAGVGHVFDRARAEARRAFALAALAVAAACCTPAGPAGIARYLWLHVTIPRIHTVDEFRHATWRSDALALGWLVLVGAVVGAALVVVRRRSSAASLSPAGASVARWSELLPVAGVAALGMVSVRFIADAALVSAPLVAVAAVSLSALLRQPMGAGSTDRTGLNRVRAAASGTVIAVLLTAVVGPRLAEARAHRPAVDVSVDITALPLAAIRFAGDNGLRDRMYNDFEIGSYLLFEGYPRHRVFVDPRLPAYPEQFHRELGRFDHDRTSWEALMLRHGVDSALLAYAGVNRRVAWWDPHNWALVYRAGDARVFARRRPERRAFIAAHEIPVTFEFAIDSGATPRPLFERPPESPVTDCEWQRRVGDVIFELDGGRVGRARSHYDRALAVPGCLAPGDEAALTAWLGALDLGARDWSGALLRLDRALVLAPEDDQTRANRATALERLGRRQAAAEDWARVAASAAGTKVGNAAAARVQALSR